MRRLSPLLLLLSLSLSACGEQTALDFRLNPNLNYTDQALLVSKLRSLRLVVDSADGASGGLYTLDRIGVAGELKISDVDGDGEAELVAEVDVAGLDRLPVIRLEQGGLPRLPLKLIFTGIADGAAVAKPGTGDVEFADGDVAWVEFSEDSVAERSVAFNIINEYRPPQVQQVDRRGDHSWKPEEVGSVFVSFSKQMDPDSVRAAFQLVKVEKVGEAGEKETPVKASRIEVQDKEIQTTSGQIWVTDATLFVDLGPDLQDLLAPGTYRIRVSAKLATDRDGRRLDHVPSKPGNQDFVSQFIISETSMATVTMPADSCPQGGCPNTWCQFGGDRCAPGMVCNKAEQRCELESCLPCEEGFVCEPTTKACIPDCRLHGDSSGCPAGSSCGQDGFCG